MIVIAGPNGSGKTSVTQKFLHHEWAEGTLYINPDEVAKDKYGDWNSPEAVLKAANYCAELRRIANRVMKGGHDVPITKIISRYFKSIENCKTVAPIVDRLYVYDNSIDGEDAKLQFRLVNGELKKMYVTEVSEWAKILLPDAIIRGFYVNNRNALPDMPKEMTTFAR